jgi:hypothetical protein
LLALRCESAEDLATSYEEVRVVKPSRAARHRSGGSKPSLQSALNRQPSACGQSAAAGRT